MLLHRTTREHFDYLLESTEVSAFPADVVDAKTSLESHQLQCAIESTEVSAVPAEVVDTKTSVEGSPVAAHIFTSHAGPMDQLTVSGIMMLGSSRALWRHTIFLLPLPRCFTVQWISHARVHCRLPRGPVCGDMGGMPGWSCHCNATATHIAPVRTQHAPVRGTSTYARKSWGGHPRCDLALTTSFGTVGQWERQHLAMAGSRRHHSPRNATVHCAARPIYHLHSCGEVRGVMYHRVWFYGRM